MINSKGKDKSYLFAYAPCHTGI